MSSRISTFQIWVGVFISVGSILIGAWKITSGIRVDLSSLHLRLELSDSLRSRDKDDLALRLRPIEKEVQDAAAMSRFNVGEFKDELEAMKAELRSRDIAAGQGDDARARYLAGKVELVRQDVGELKVCARGISDTVQVIVKAVDSLEVQVEGLRPDASRTPAPADSTQARPGWLKRTLSKIIPGGGDE